MSGGSSKLPFSPLGVETAIHRMASSDQCVQSVLNHAPRERLGPRKGTSGRVFRTPLEVFTGQQPIRPLLQAFSPLAPSSTPTIIELRARQIIKISDVADSLEAIHRDVTERVSKSRKCAIEQNNLRANVQAIRFSPGDLVLVRRAVRGRHKLDLPWKGPRRVINALSDWIYEVENILTGTREHTHARRLTIYRAGLEGVDLSPELKSVIENSEGQTEIAADICSIREHDGNVEVQVEWDGLPADEDFTWEPVEQVSKDLPGILPDFLHNSGQRATKKRVLREHYGSA